MQWTFLDKSTKEYTHAIHLYPARMHPEIARRLISKYTTKSNIILDPFMGSGGVLLEGILNGNDSIGIDVNPFAVLLSKVKTTPIQKNLEKPMEKIIKNSAKDYLESNYHTECIPDIDVDNWYNLDTLNVLSTLKHHIFKIKDKDVRDFFKICFSLTIRKSSYQRNNSWKIHRMSENDRMLFEPSPDAIFREITSNNIKKMNNLVNANPKGQSFPLFADSRNIKLDKKARLVVTSPPYGDHSTTVAYGQFSKHSSLWLELPKVKVDKIGLGGKNKDIHDLDSETLNKILDKVRKNDEIISKNKKPYRTGIVFAFFYDLDKCLEKISENLMPNSHCCFVVANRTVRRVTIPTDLITMELASKYGFKVKQVIFRNIPNKMIPIKNAPENVSEKTGKTMTKESVIIMEY